MNITAIKQQVKRPDRYSIFVDGKYGFSLSETALLDSRLASGQELDAAALASYKQLSADDKAYGMALRYAAMRLRSEWEMRSYLTRKDVAEPAADTIIAKLKRLQLVDDDQFARRWVENRRLLKPTSTRKLRQELLAKRIAEDIISAVLQAGGTQENDQTALAELVAKKRRLSRYQADPTKLMQYLARQGFGYDDIKRATAKEADE